jgi:hypothetical protein
MTNDDEAIDRLNGATVQDVPSRLTSLAKPEGGKEEGWHNNRWWEDSAQWL